MKFYVEEKRKIYTDSVKAGEEKQHGRRSQI